MRYIKYQHPVGDLWRRPLCEAAIANGRAGMLKEPQMTEPFVALQDHHNLQNSHLRPPQMVHHHEATLKDIYSYKKKQKKLKNPQKNKNRYTSESKRPLFWAMFDGRDAACISELLVEWAEREPTESTVNAWVHWRLTLGRRFSEDFLKAFTKVAFEEFLF